MQRVLGCMLLLLISAVACSSNSPPRKPVLKQCRSPDKETFTCQWDPHADDRENATYRLFYKKERTGVQECPDYRTAGKNTCFFDKSHTSIWVEYFLTLVAFNAFGNTSSDVYQMDVMDIVKPSPPENVTLRLELNKDSPTIHVTWNPYNPGGTSGWVTPKYQLRFKKEDTNVTMDAGTQTYFSLYSACPGEQYLVQVRCALDHSQWSEWSNPMYIKVPKNKPLWILIAFFSAIPFFTALCLFFIMRKSIKQWLLPTVPGPKIKGVDVQLLKNGRSEEVTRALLANQAFPQMMPWTNQEEIYLVVCDETMLLVEDLKERNGMDISNKFGTEANINNKSSIVKNEPHKEEVQIPNYFVYTSDSGFDKQEATQQEGDMGLVDYSGVSDIKGEHTIIVGKLNSSSNSKTTEMNRHGEENLPEDYTSVKEVKSDHIVLLGDPSCINNMEYRDGGKDTSPHPVIDKKGVYAEFLRNGYVDNISTLIL
ncbi:prolactin receptor b isoform X2 [Eucyclogobius newberryi]|uniref:prolactin receptor b isoform X2 n=1 Tax=Eucyclogobius newberryi TaxID=166745 RepID=UPI003B59A49C